MWCTISNIGTTTGDSYFIGHLVVQLPVATGYGDLIYFLFHYNLRPYFNVQCVDYFINIHCFISSPKGYPHYVLNFCRDGYKMF